MPKLPRITVRQFGASGVSTNFGQFGSKKAAAPQTSQNPSVIMSLAAWINGWTQAAVGARFNPYLEDMNGFCLVVMYFIANLFERGVPDWDSTTTYYKGALVQDPAGSGQYFYSLTDNNLNQALPLGASNAQWRWQNPPVLAKGASATVGTIPKIGAVGANGGYAGTVATVDSALSDDGVNVTTALPLKFPDATIQTTAADPVSNQNVVTGSRSLDTVFQNTGTKPKFVCVSVLMNNISATTNAKVYTDANPAPSTMVANARFDPTSPQGIPIFFIVLPGNYYKVTTDAALSLLCWTEWN